MNSGFLSAVGYRQFLKPKFINFLYVVVELLLKIHGRSIARLILRPATRFHKPNSRQLSLISRAWLDKPSVVRITRMRAEHLKLLSAKPIREKNIPRLLYLLGRYEVIKVRAPVEIGDIVARQMVSVVGQERVKAAAETALKRFPASPYLNYLYNVTLANSGDFIIASNNLSAKIESVSKRKTKSIVEKKVAKQQFESLRNAWRVVDQISRENMAWLDDVSGDGYENLVSKDKNSREGATTQSWMLNFKEPFLQSRNEVRYLELCEEEFKSAETLMIKLKLIKEMVRKGTRRQLVYHNAYQLANSSFLETKSSIDKLLSANEADFGDRKSAFITTQNLILAIDIAKAFSEPEKVVLYKEKLHQISQWEVFSSSRWIILPALVIDDVGEWGSRSINIYESIPTPPEIERDLKAFFQWAMHMREFTLAEKVFRELKLALKGSQAALYYVNILQRQSRFTDALNAIKLVHGHMLAKTHTINPYNHWNLIRRHGELTFLRKTSNFYLKVPQPEKPKGVIFVGARNIDQLRKYPIVVLMELKRSGWAVVPFVEGLLPREMTGIPAIDTLHGCLTIELEFRPEVRQHFPRLEGFKSDPEAGILKWGKIDMSHSMMEDARINKRAFDVDLTCPVLYSDLQRLSNWTEKFGQASQYAYENVHSLGFSCGLMSLFNSRMPDSLFRFYCDEIGSTDSFFCLHSANGYENYFENFRTTISTKIVIRNMTEYSHVRSSSLPVPELFEEFYNKNKGDIGEVLARVEGVTSVPRTTGGNKEIDPAAAACKEKVLEWRQNGGSVTCMFGRVVCDSAVPFDGGPAHVDLKDWVNHTIDTVRDTNTMLLIKPHPHELNEQIATYLNQYFTDLMEVDVPDNVLILGHRWFDIESLKEFVDLGLIYNGTTAVELALMNMPAVFCGHFGPLDYPVGQLFPKSRQQYENMLLFKSRAKTAPDMRARAAMWLEYMSNSKFAVDYRYHSRPITNKVVYPPYWIEDDISRYVKYGDSNVEILAKRSIGMIREPHA